MEVSVWSNSRKGTVNATFGLGISRPDRKQFFNIAFPTISIDIDGHLIMKRLPDSFWRNCPHICHKSICEFIKRRGLNIWHRGKPPVLILQPISKGHFSLNLKEGH
jgi:hypothetical protein